MKCTPCLTGVHKFCEEDNCDCTHDLESVEDSEEESEDEDWRRGSQYSRKPARHRKRVSTLKDPESTGRKEAARLFPLSREAPCEWAGKVSVGGGQFPINGCPISEGCRQQSRHHGPDKNTLNNSEDNVHRIGHKCHNRWHAKNDPDYDWSKGARSD